MDPQVGVDPQVGILSSQIVVSAMIVYAIEWLKRMKAIPWVTYESAKLNRSIAAVASAAAAIGIHFKFDHEAGALIITGLSVASLAHGGWEVARAYITTKVMYDVTRRPALEKVAAPTP